jgi:hypothetical protein
MAIDLGGMAFWRGRTTRSRAAVPGGRPELCDLCAAVIRDGSELYATVADSSAVDPHRQTPDGQRRLVACTPHHLRELVDWYDGRPFDDEELWAGIVARAQRGVGPDADIDIEDLVVMTGLTLQQVMRAGRWQAVWQRWVPERDRRTVR